MKNKINKLALILICLSFLVTLPILFVNFSKNSKPVFAEFKYTNESKSPDPIEKWDPDKHLYTSFLYDNEFDGEIKKNIRSPFFGKETINKISTGWKNVENDPLYKFKVTADFNDEYNFKTFDKGDKYTDVPHKIQDMNKFSNVTFFVHTTWDDTPAYRSIGYSYTWTYYNNEGFNLFKDFNKYSLTVKDKWAGPDQSSGIAKIQIPTDTELRRKYGYGMYSLKVSLTVGDTTIALIKYGVEILAFYYHSSENKQTGLILENNMGKHNIQNYAGDWEAQKPDGACEVYTQNFKSLSCEKGTEDCLAEMDIYSFSYDEWDKSGKFYRVQKDVKEVTELNTGIHMVILRCLNYRKTLFLRLIVDNDLPSTTADNYEGNLINHGSYTHTIYTQSDSVRFWMRDRHRPHIEVVTIINGKPEWINEYTFANGDTLEYVFKRDERYKHIKEWRISIYDDAGRKPNSNYWGGSSVEYTVVFDKESPTYLAESKNKNADGDYLYNNKFQTINFNDDTSPILKVEIEHIWQSNKGIAFPLPPKNTVIYNPRYEKSSYTSNDELKEIKNGYDAIFKWEVDEDSIYKITVTDFANNSTSFTIKTWTIPIYEDIDRFKNRYTKTEYYRVTLPKEFGDKEGKYLFLNHSDALAFAEKMEEDTFREDLGNNEYKYFTRQQRDKEAMQIYRDINTYKLVLRYYALKYISPLNRNLNGIYEESTASAKCMICDSYGFREGNWEFIQNEANNPYAVERIHPDEQIPLPYYKNIDVQIKGYIQHAPYKEPEGTEKEFNPNESMDTIIKKAKLPRGGIYKITKKDECGNVFSYFCYLDADAPKATISVEKGATSEEINIDADYIASHNGSMRYTSFTLSSFSDNIDGKLVCAEISGGTYGINEKFFPGDNPIELSPKKGGKGGGIYTIKIYDRSGNVLSFKVIIAEGKPFFTASTLKHKDKAVTFNIYPGTNNNLTSIKIYKVHYDNSVDELIKDDSNPPAEVNIINTEYTFNNGGTYRIVLIDEFGQHSETPDFVFNKGLPEGFLSVTERSVTNKNVSFVFNHIKYSVELYVGTEKTKQDIDGDNLKEANKSDAQKICTYEVVAKPGIQDLLFTFRIYEKGNQDIFRNYEFIMDTQPPKGRFTDESGAGLILDAQTKVHNGTFMLECKEHDVAISYTLNGSRRYYEPGEVLSENGTYIFQLTDKVGNSLTGLEITIDTIVDYVVKGTYKTKESDGTLVSNKPITIQMAEPFVRYSINGRTNGQKNVLFDKDGSYELNIEDKYKNKTTIRLIIDQTPPTAVASESLTKNDVTIKWELHSDAWLYKNDAKEGKQLKVFSTDTVQEEIVAVGELVSEEGWYTLVVTDDADNRTKVTFQIKRTIYAKISTPNDSIVTNSVYLETYKPEGFLKTESISKTVLLNGSVLENAENEFNVPGKYEITVKDICSNEKTFSFEIIKQKMNYFSLHLADGHKIQKVTKNEELVPEPMTEFKDNGLYTVEAVDGNEKLYLMEFQINNIKPIVKFKRKGGFMHITRTTPYPVSAKLYKNGKLEKNNFNFDPIKTSGKYKLLLEDEFGNINEYSFKYIKTLNAGGIVGIVIAIAITATIVTLGLLKRYKNKKA